MSLLDQERSAIQTFINLNPATISVDRVTVSTNARGVPYDGGVSSSVALTNPVRIVANKKERTRTVNTELVYYSDKTYWVISDHETEIIKGDKFTWNSRQFEIMDVDTVTISGAEIVYYQAELREYTV